MHLYDVAVPVLLRYLTQLDKLLDKLADEPVSVLTKRIQDDMLPFAQQVNCSVGFALRACFPLMKLPIPDISYADDSVDVLKKNIQQAIKTLDHMTPEDMLVSDDELITFQAGQSQEIQLTALLYVQQYALPNFFFHFSMAYAVLRVEGVAVGKRNFDGYHQFPENFSF